MGLTAMLARQATRTAHVLVLEAPGGWLARVALEQEIGARGWRIAASPADADVLAVCGAPGPELAGLVDRVWDQLPGPRARIQADTPAGVGSALDTAAAGLLDSAAQREDGLARPATPDAGDEHEGMDHGEMDHGGMDHGEMDHGEMDHGEMDHGDMDHGGMDHGDMDHGGMDHGGMDHGGMDHGDMDMAPAGIPLAGGGEDRDGLEMDVLHVSLGPVLPHWPAGLVLRCALQGDVVVDAEARLVDHGSGAHHTDAVGEARDARAVRWDAVASLLALAGWADGAARARRVRDLVLATGVEAAAREAEALRRRIGRSRLLRWTLRGVGPVSDADVHGHRVPAALAGDTHTRLLDQVRRALDPDDDPAPLPVDALPALVRGLDLATARLVVASVAADLDLRERTHAGTAHG